jgi:cysteine desulfurase family protein (TIGR01976 family)
MDLNTDYVRKHFPSLEGDWVFLDNAGGSQTVQPVVDRITDYYRTSDVQLGATYEPSRVAGARVDEAVGAMAEFVNAADPSEIVMGSSTTALLRTLANSLGRTLSPGDEVIVTNCDHEANIGPWVDLERFGAHIKTWNVNPESFELELADLDALLTARTRLVAFTHASNILGGVTPIRRFANRAHEVGALVCVDGVAYAPHRLIDVHASGADFYAFSFYKVYGPHQALLYGRRDHLLRLPGVNHFFFTEASIPSKFEPGGVNYELTYGLLGIRDYLEGVAREHGKGGEGFRADAEFAYSLFAEHERALNKRLLDFLASKSKVRVIGGTDPDADTRVPTVSFVVDGMRSDEIPPHVDEHKIGIRFGHFYAKRLIDDLRLDEREGVVRVSMVHYNTAEEIERLIAVLDRIL